MKDQYSKPRIILSLKTKSVHRATIASTLLSAKLDDYWPGQIFQDVMLEGIKEHIVCLPVYDAVAVQQQHQDWTKEAMPETWREHMGGVASMDTTKDYLEGKLEQLSNPYND